MAERVDVEVDTGPLLPVASARATPTPLDPGQGRSGTLDRRWNVIVAEYPDEESSLSLERRSPRGAAPALANGGPDRTRPTALPSHRRESQGRTSVTSWCSRAALASADVR
jgi:hypothetical protein